MKKKPDEVCPKSSNGKHEYKKDKKLKFHMRCVHCRDLKMRTILPLKPNDYL